MILTTTLNKEEATKLLSLMAKLEQQPKEEVAKAFAKRPALEKLINSVKIDYIDTEYILTYEVE